MECKCSFSDSRKKNKKVSFLHLIKSLQFAQSSHRYSSKLLQMPANPMDLVHLQKNIMLDRSFCNRRAQMIRITCKTISDWIVLFGSFAKFVALDLPLCIRPANQLIQIICKNCQTLLPSLHQAARSK